MTDDSVDQQLLAQKQRAIELLAQESGCSVDRVQALFLAEYGKLAAGAHIRSYLSLLTRNSVR